MKQVLGEAKTRRCEAILGKPIRVAYANGVFRQHFEAECWPVEGDAVLVNWRTGVISPYQAAFRSKSGATEEVR